MEPFLKWKWEINLKRQIGEEVAYLNLSLLGGDKKAIDWPND